MRRKVGTLCMVAGAALILCALLLFAFNRYESWRAGTTAEEVLSQVVQRVATRNADSLEAAALPDPYDPEMTEVEIDGYPYVGYLSIPAVDLELPVMSGWDYARLKIAPCRYAGSTKTDDLVVCAHNYTRHFGRLQNLAIGDTVRFTDMDGVVSVYEVVSLQTLAPAAVDEMTDSGYDLTLFTCTYGGATRVTVRCEQVDATGAEQA